MSASAQDSTPPTNPAGRDGTSLQSQTGNGNENNPKNTNSTESNKTRLLGATRNAVNSIDRNFCGDTPAIVIVLGLRTERVTKKVPFDTFREKLANYVLTTLKNAEDVVELIEEQVDPRASFEENNKPQPLTDEQKEDDMDVMIQTQYLKIYATRKFEIKDNINKIYGLFWGQFTHSL